MRISKQSRYQVTVMWTNFYWTAGGRKSNVNRYMKFSRGEERWSVPLTQELKVPTVGQFETLQQPKRQRSHFREPLNVLIVTRQQRATWLTRCVLVGTLEKSTRGSACLQVGKNVFMCELITQKHIWCCDAVTLTHVLPAASSLFYLSAPACFLLIVVLLEHIWIWLPFRTRFWSRPNVT